MTSAELLRQSPGFCSFRGTRDLKSLSFQTFLIGNLSALVITDIGHRESILVSFRIDPCYQPVGMTQPQRGCPPLPITAGASPTTVGLPTQVRSVESNFSMGSDRVR